MTSGEEKVYDYIISYRKKNGRSPSVRDISSGLGLYSTYSVQRHIASLIEAGVLTNDAGKPRSLVPTCEIREASVVL